MEKTNLSFFSSTRHECCVLYSEEKNIGKWKRKKKYFSRKLQLTKTLLSGLLHYIYTMPHLLHIQSSLNVGICIILKHHRHLFAMPYAKIKELFANSAKLLNFTANARQRATATLVLVSTGTTTNIYCWLLKNPQVCRLHAEPVCGMQLQ